MTISVLLYYLCAMSLPITINYRKTALPLAWEEVTLAQYSRLYNCAHDADYIDYAAALLHIDRALLLSMPLYLLKANIVNNLQWIAEPPQDLQNAIVPDYIALDNELFKVPQSFEALRYGQIVLFQNTLNKYLEADLNTIKPEAYAKLLAIVLAADEKQELSDKRIEELELMALNASFIEVMPALNFFLSCLEKLESERRTPSAIKILMRKLGQVWTALRNLATIL